jgi:hypothetical protein
MTDNLPTPEGFDFAADLIIPWEYVTTPTQIKQVYGMSQSVYKAIESVRLPSVRIGGVILLDRRDVVRLWGAPPKPWPLPAYQQYPKKAPLTPPERSGEA